MKDTHPQVKFDVFERLNTGAVKLTAQELRHGIYHGRLMDFIDKLAKHKGWKKLLALGNDRRMRAEEFVVRLLAFQTSFETYFKPMAAFLNKFCESHRDLDDARAATLGEIFEDTLRKLKLLYADYVFKIFRKDGTVVSEFNAALFDAEVMSTTALDGQVEVSDAARTQIQQALADLFDEPTFQKAITRATSDETQVKTRVETLRQVVSDAI